ncbi:uncharacterized protein CELE_ZK1290.15 [Caenorhabditis elegans]|uniref:Uncharacterized protein n=1 Tax=Caenorhabditis elegans TaxID=6239 RepID=A9Z1J9_CAEEL|nr:Uncharacterized protein CELE_ZK1290.15 [Caenorhabditis elegans]CCD65945.2 Uncharacterized protein CELE_ZK1290.15 [Caenorhabditis elegans]
MEEFGRVRLFLSSSLFPPLNDNSFLALWNRVAQLIPEKTSRQMFASRLNSIYSLAFSSLLKIVISLTITG